MCSVQMNKFEFFGGIFHGNSLQIQLTLKYMIRFTAAGFLRCILYLEQFCECSLFKCTHFLQFKRRIPETDQLQQWFRKFRIRTQFEIHYVNVAEHMHQFGIHIQFRITEFHIVATFLQCLKQWGLLVHPLAVIIKGFIIFIPVSGQNIGNGSLCAGVCSYRIFKIGEITKYLTVFRMLVQQFRDRSGIHRIQQKDHEVLVFRHHKLFVRTILIMYFFLQCPTGKHNTDCCDQQHQCQSTA